MKKIVLTTFFLVSSLFAEEPSVFGAGDLSSPTPYGLTKTEKYIVKNRDKLQVVEKKSKNNFSNIVILQEKISGLESVVDGLSKKSHNNKVAFNSWLTTYNQDNTSMKESLKKAIEESERKQHEIDLAFQVDIKNLTAVITELSQVIDTINSSYVSKDEFNKIVEDVNNFKELLLKELKKVNRPLVDPLSKMENFEIEKKALQFYKKQYYTNAIEYYEYLIQKNYKPARSHYMLGEIYYNRKNYKKAISYFKESAKRYSKANYMPTLMLHSALSMIKIGDLENGEKFLEALIVKYPDSKEAKVAKEELSN